MKVLKVLAAIVVALVVIFGIVWAFVMPDMFKQLIAFERWRGENTRASLFQEVDTSKAEAEAAIARLEKLSAAFGRTAGTARNAVRGPAIVAQVGKVRDAGTATAVSPTPAAAAPTGAGEQAAGQ